MPGAIVFKPIEAKLTHDTDWITKMSPYCVFTVGDEKIKGEVCKRGGTNPHWQDTVIVPMNFNECIVELFDQHTLLPDDNIGQFIVDLDEIEFRGNLKQWYPVFYKGKHAGELLLDAVFTSDEADLSQGEPLPNSDGMVEPSEWEIQASKERLSQSSV